MKLTFKRTTTFVGDSEVIISGGEVQDQDEVDVTVPGAQTMSEDGTLTFDDIVPLQNPIEVAGHDNGHHFVTVSIEDGALTVGAVASGLVVTGEGTNLLRLEGPLWKINDALDGLTYTPPADAFGQRTLTIHAEKHDGDVGDGEDTGTVLINITGVNDEPTMTATGNNQIFTEGGPAADLFGAVAASAVEAGQNFTSMTLTVSNVTDGASEILSLDGSDVALTNGNIVATAAHGLNVTVAVAGNVATVTFAGASLSAAALQTLVNNLTYRNSSQDPTDANRVVTITQLVDSGSNTAPNDNNVALSLASIVNVNPVDDEPILAAIANNPVFTEDGASADIFGAVTASTVEAGQSLSAMTLTISNVTDGALEILFIDGTPVALINGNSVTTGTNGLGVHVSVAANVATLSFAGAMLSAAQLQILVDGLAYRNNSSNPTDANRVVTITQLVDSGSNAAPNDNVAALGLASTINVNPVNNAPALQSLTGLSYTENDPATIVAPGATLSDVDSTNFDGGTLTGAFTANGTADDRLEIRNQGSGAGQIGVSGSNVSYGGVIIGSFAGGVGLTDLVVTFNASATAAAVEALLRDITYRNVSDDPSPLARTVTGTVTDGDGGSAQGSATINVIAVNDAAIVRDDALTTDEATAIVGGSLFADNGSGPDSDPDDPLIIAAVNGSALAVGNTITLASGALLRVNGNGSFNYDPNHVFDVTPTAGSGASNTPASDSFQYSLAGGGTATATITINGLDSNDLLLDSGAADVLAGGIGTDVYIVHNASDLVIELVGQGTNDTVFSAASYTLAAGSEVETLSTINWSDTAALNLTGNEFGNQLFGNAGANTLDGKGGNDVLIGLGGNDILLGREGNDSYFVDDMSDFVVESAGEGDDIVYTRGSYILAAGLSVEVLGTADNLATTAINLTGNELDNYLVGNAGANLLDGGDGVDQLWGRGGDDSYYVDGGDAVVEYAGDGFDIVYARSSFVLGVGMAVEVLGTIDNTAATAINLSGNALDNYITGNAGANTLDGGGGSDVLWGREGNDSYFADAGDTVIEAAGQGNDILYAGSDFTLVAGLSIEILGTVNNFAATAINLTGNELSNLVTGNAGANVLDGKLGADLLHGREGADTFVFSTALGGGNVDLILDFGNGADKIALDDAIFAGIGTPGSFDANAFFAGTAAHDADDRIIYDQSTGQLYYDADGNGAGDAVLFAGVFGPPALTAADFTVI